MTDVVIIDLAAINEAKETMKAKFPTMVQYFMEDSESYIESIREGIAAVSSERIVSPAHTLKSSARQMGAIRMSEIAKLIEMIAREQADANQNNMAPFSELLTLLKTAFEDTKTAYQQHAA